MTKPVKPAEFKAFEGLLKQLLTVPKSELDKQMHRYEAKKAKRKKK
jgi:hypothetical protein